MIERLALVICVISVLTTRSLHADLTAYEGFDYPTDHDGLIGADGGIGFSGPWREGGYNARTNESFQVAESSLERAELITSGNRMAATSATQISGLTRDLKEAMGKDGTIRYLSFLLRPEGELHEGAYNGFFGLVLECDAEPELFVGKPGAGDIEHYAMEDRGGPSPVVASTPVVTGTEVLIVVKCQFSDKANDVFQLYLNPAVGGSEPDQADAVKEMTLDEIAGLTIYATGSFSMDELRLGETFADVVPQVATPSPSTEEMPSPLSAVHGCAPMCCGVANTDRCRCPVGRLKCCRMPRRGILRGRCRR